MKVSVIISTRNEVAMLSVTIRSALEELKAIRGGYEVVVCDNSDSDKVEAAKSVIPTGYLRAKKVKFLTQDYPCLFTARETAAQASSGKYILCLDAHMLCGRNMILDLVNFAERMEAIPEVYEKMGFLHAPISWADRDERHAKHDRDMQVCELGDWGKRFTAPSKMSWKGMPWLCKRDWFLGQLGGYGALSEHRMSWGGGDMHIGVKPWLLGYENWAVPTNPGIHLGPYGKNPQDMPKYRTYSISGNTVPCLGYLVSSYVLGGEECIQRNLPTVEERFKTSFKPLLPQIKVMGDRERKWLLSKQVMAYQEMLDNPPWASDVPRMT